MNIRLITKALELTDDDWALAAKLRGLTETERELLRQTLEPAKPAKKAAKKSPQKSRKAASLAGAIAGTAGNKPVLCSVCGNVEDYVDHSEPSPSYHVFAPTGQVAAAVGGD